MYSFCGGQGEADLQRIAASLVLFLSSNTIRLYADTSTDSVPATVFACAIVLAVWKIYQLYRKVVPVMNAVGQSWRV